MWYFSLLVALLVRNHIAYSIADQTFIIHIGKLGQEKLSATITYLLTSEIKQCPFLILLKQDKRSLCPHWWSQLVPYGSGYQVLPSCELHGVMQQLRPEINRFIPL